MRLQHGFIKKTHIKKKEKKKNVDCPALYSGEFKNQCNNRKELQSASKLKQPCHTRHLHRSLQEEKLPAFVTIS